MAEFVILLFALSVLLGLILTAVVVMVFVAKMCIEFALDTIDEFRR